MEYILTILPTLKKSAFKELRKMDPNILIKQLDSSIFLADTKDANLSNKLRESIFVRHMHPVNKKISLTGKKENDLESILEAIKGIVSIKNKKFMVQCRKASREVEYNSKDVEVFIGSQLESLSGKAVFQDDEVISSPNLSIVSILIWEKECYVGISTIKDNLEPYSDPARIFSRWEDSICRAEFKLREAIRKFEIVLKPGMSVIDLGAAPGGWSKVLKDYGLNVTAIDPAVLDKRVQGVTHFKGRAENFESKERFDMLVNDMNMDPRESAKITLSMTKFLKKGARIVFTAKLVYKCYDELIAETKQLFGEKFDIIAIKNLFHNHEEVTFYLRLK